MSNKVEVILLEEALDFINKLDLKTRRKIYFNIDKAMEVNDPKVFKKLTKEIWEFRTKYSGVQYRLFAFWDKTDKHKTLVISTHGMIKKIDKIPRAEIEKAMKIRGEYFQQ